MDAQKKKKLFTTYLITSLVLISLVVACLFYEGAFSCEDAKAVVEKICNSFTVPGIMFAGVGLLSYLSSLGAYDGLSYSFVNFALHNLWFIKQPKKYKTFYDYKEAKDKKGRVWWPNLIIVGGASIVIGVIFLIISYLI